MTNTIYLDTQINLLTEQEFGEASAAISLNPAFQWAKIIVTDDKANLNKQRIPREEFVNLIRTGLFAPVKMSEAEITNHKEAIGKPIGTITQLLEDTDKLIALAALWKKERPDDVAMLKDMYTKGNLPNVSWEISYAEEKEEDGNIKALYNTSLDALVVVSNPAYAGRTAFIAMASQEGEDIKEEETPKMDELELAKQTIADLETKVADLEQYKTQADAELEELRTYKEAKEKLETEAAKFNDIKKKFSDAGIEKDETYFTEKKDYLLTLTEDSLDFMLQEMVAFAEKYNKKAQSELEIPEIVNKETGKANPIELAKALRERNSK